MSVLRECSLKFLAIIASLNFCINCKISLPVSTKKGKKDVRILIRIVSSL